MWSQSRSSWAISLPSVAESAPVNSTYASQQTYLLSSIIASANVSAFPVIAQTGPSWPVAVDSLDESGTYKCDNW